MTWQTQLLENSGTVQLLCSGSVSADDLMMMAIEAGYLVRQHGCGKILVDLSDVKHDFTADELCVLLDALVEDRIPTTTKCGVVFSPGRPTQAFSKFLSIAKSYGYQADFLVGGEQRDIWLMAAT